MRAAKPIDGIAMTDVLQNIYICEEDRGMVKLTGKPNMHESIVRIGKGTQKTPEIRYRAEFKSWSTNLKIRYNADFFSADEVINLLAQAGLLVGWGEMRPEKGYSNGMYAIQGKPKVVEPRA